MSLLLILNGLSNSLPANYRDYPHGMSVESPVGHGGYTTADSLGSSQVSSLTTIPPQLNTSSQPTHPPKSAEQKANHAFALLTLTCVAFGLTSFIGMPVLSEALSEPQKHALRKASPPPPLNKNEITTYLEERYADAVIEDAAKKMHAIEPSTMQAIRDAYTSPHSAVELEQHIEAQYKAHLLVADALLTHLQNLTPKPDERFMRYANLRHNQLKKIVDDPKVVARFAVSPGTVSDIPLSSRTEHHQFEKWADTVVKSALVRRHLVAPV